MASSLKHTGVLVQPPVNELCIDILLLLFLWSEEEKCGRETKIERKGGMMIAKADNCLSLYCSALIVCDCGGAVFAVIKSTV